MYPEGSEKKASPRLLAKVSFLKANFSRFAETLKHGREKGREREKATSRRHQREVCRESPSNTHGHTHTHTHPTYSPAASLSVHPRLTEEEAGTE